MSGRETDLIFRKDYLRGLNYFHVFVLPVKIILSPEKKIKSVPWGIYLTTLHATKLL